MGQFNRRYFLNRFGSFSLSALLATLSQPAWSRDLERALERAGKIHPEELAGDEDFWHYVQQSYTVSPSIINLNNGGVAPSPKVVQDAMKRYHDLSNEAPSYYMWRILDQGRVIVVGGQLHFQLVSNPQVRNPQHGGQESI